MRRGLWRGASRPLTDRRWGGFEIVLGINRDQGVSKTAICRRYLVLGNGWGSNRIVLQCARLSSPLPPDYSRRREIPWCLRGMYYSESNPILTHHISLVLVHGHAKYQTSWEQLRYQTGRLINPEGKKE